METSEHGSWLEFHEQDKWKAEIKNQLVQRYMYIEVNIKKGRRGKEEDHSQKRA